MKTIKNKLTLSFIGIAVLPLIIVGVMVIVVNLKTLKQQAIDIQSRTAQRVGVQVKDYLTYF